MFDITKKAAIETKTVLLTEGDESPLLDEKGNQLSITVYGPGSKAYQAAQAKRTNRALDRLKKKGKIDQTAEDAARENAEFLAACTISFNGFSYPTDPKSEGFDMFLAAYQDGRLGYIRDQVGAFVGDWANFTPGSAKS